MKRGLIRLPASLRQDCIICFGPIFKKRNQPAPELRRLLRISSIPISRLICGPWVVLGCWRHPLSHHLQYRCHSMNLQKDCKSPRQKTVIQAGFKAIEQPKVCKYDCKLPRIAETRSFTGGRNRSKNRNIKKAFKPSSLSAKSQQRLLELPLLKDTLTPLVFS